MKRKYCKKTLLGELTVVADEHHVYKVCFGTIADDMPCRQTALIEQTFNQIEEYLAGSRREFTVPLRPEGTPFQMSVWNALQTIPYGEVWSYKKLAEAVGNPAACRAVGMANNRNPLAIIVPCHRVVGADGKLVGYAGGLDKKQLLLQIEQPHLL